MRFQNRDMIKIENSKWSAQINPKGAELSSLINKKTERELIWQGNPQYWKRRAPILFPIIGKLKEDAYWLNGQRYSMQKHGFCRDANFTPIQQNKKSVLFELTESETTLKQYPYRFSLQVEFKLTRKGLVNRFYLFNRNQEIQYFCLGGHPAFNVPMEKGVSFTDYQIRFEKKETSPLWFLKEDMLAGKKENWLDQTKSFNLKTELFDEDALIFHHLKSKRLTIASPKGNSFVSLHLGTFPMVGIWTKEGGAPFLCIEPWHGVDDAIESEGDFTQKWEVIALPPQKKFTTWFSINGR